jgi:hypothetical protein
MELAIPNQFHDNPLRERRNPAVICGRLASITASSKWNRVGLQG